MSKRDDKHDRVERDFYPTPAEVTLRLAPYLTDVKTFGEPMAGDGAIIRPLEGLKKICAYAADIAPQGRFLEQGGLVKDVFDTTAHDFRDCNVLVTNPPWPSPLKNRTINQHAEGSGSPTVQIIQHLIQFKKPVWMLLSADMAHNGYFREHLWAHCRLIVSVGRVMWMPNTNTKSMDNNCWYCFTHYDHGNPIFICNDG